MYTLIFIFAIKTQFNTSVDVKQFATYTNEIECANSAWKIKENLKKIDSDIKVEFICEKK